MSKNAATRQAHQKTIAQLEREYEIALQAELNAVGKLPARATKAQTDHCWKLAEATNAAMRALMVARGN